MAREISLECLPRRNGKNIDWSKSVNYSINFIYDNVHDSIKILKYFKSNNESFVVISNEQYGEKTISISNLSKCRLGRYLNGNINGFVYKTGDIVRDDKRNLTITNSFYKLQGTRRIKTKSYNYHCNKCGFEYSIEERDLIKNKYGCSCCSSRVIVKDINSLWATHRDLVKKYFVNTADSYCLSQGMLTKVLVKCPDCEKTRLMSVKHLIDNGFRCNHCSDKNTYPNKFIRKMLDLLNIDYVPEYTAEWTQGKRYDVYFEYNHYKYAIEMDGIFHYTNNFISGQTLLESKQNDMVKDKLAEINDVILIRIDCNYSGRNRFEYIKNNILNSTLNLVFDLDKINFNLCHEFAVSSLVKQVCDLYESGITIKDLAQRFKLNPTTIRDYLHQGYKINWCSYNPKRKGVN